MGYFTKYNMKIEQPDNYSREGELELYLASDESCEYTNIRQFLCDYAEPCKWYSHEIDILVLSKKFPEIKITLTGKGEERTDYWIKYFRDGKMQTCFGEMKIIYQERTLW